jgi:hypothetical protein
LFRSPRPPEDRGGEGGAVPLIKVKAQDWSGDFAFAPPTREMLVNTDEI